MNYLIDYFQFVLKPSAYQIDFSDILELLDLSEFQDKFVSYGSKYHYQHCFSWNCVRIYTPSFERVKDMGYMVELTGQGCRFIEDNFKRKYECEYFDWKMFVNRLVTLTDNNIGLNINRVDFAYDDFTGLLNLDVVEECAVNRDYVSLFRNVPFVNERYAEIPFHPEWTQIKSLSNDSCGRTIYFGSKRSNAFCKFYDKLQEQKVKFKGNMDKLRSLSDINHWVRFEFTFKRKSANSVIAAMNVLSPDDFSVYLSEVINGYIRFIDRDDTNATRCTVKKWWADFIGTARRSSLTCVGVPKDPVAGAVAWLEHSLAPTLDALIYRFGTDSFIDMIRDSAAERELSQKQKDIMFGDPVRVKSEYTAAELWQTYLPDVVLLHIQKLKDERLEV